jgi:hypothetical protein
MLAAVAVIGIYDVLLLLLVVVVVVVLQMS